MKSIKYYRPVLQDLTTKGGAKKRFKGHMSAPESKKEK